MTAAYWLAAAIGHAALWVDVVNRSHGLIANRPLSKGVTLACGLALVGIPWWAASQGGFAASGGAGWVAWYGAACVAFAAYAVVARLAIRFDPLRLGGAKPDVEIVDLGASLGSQATGSAAIAWAAGLPGNQLLRLRVERRELRFDRLPPEADGLRIAHLTDLHLSNRLSARYFDEVVTQTNAFEPELVCLTGDIVERTPQLEWVEPLLGDLRPRLGAYFVLGNHDVKIDSERLRRRLEAIGFRDAGRGRFRLGPETGGMVVCGDERPWFPAGEGAADDAPFTIALVHTPDRFAWARRNRVDFALAGHNHGGQVCFPLLGPLLCPSRHGVRFVSGTFHADRTTLHVSRGTGSLFPLRYNCPPELGLFTLRGAETDSK